MCWLLIRTRSNPRPTAWKAGDIVEVRPDACTWGRAEGLPSFYRIQIAGVEADRVKARLEARDVTLNPDTGQETAYRRVRLFRIDPADLPLQARQELQTTGQLVVTKAQALNYIRDNYGLRVPSLD